MFALVNTDDNSSFRKAGFADVVTMELAITE